MYIEENLRNKIIGEILKDEITKSGLTASDISRIIGRTRANVSQILNGRISINPRVINQIFAIVNKDFKIDYDENKYFDAVDFVESIIHDFCYYVDGNFVSSIERYVENKENRYSLAYPKYMLLELMIAHYNREFKKISSKIEYLETIKDLFNDNEKKLYLIIKAKHLIDNDNFSTALKTLQEAEEHMSSSSSCADGIIKLYKGIALINLRKSFNAFCELQDASRILSNCQCYRRHLAAMANIGIVYSQLGEYDKAENVYLKTINDANQLSRTNAVTSCYKNLTYLCFIQGRFNDAIQYANHITKEDGPHNIFVAWSYFFLKDYDNCIKYTKRIVEYRVDEYDDMMYELLCLFINGESHQNKIEILNKMVEYCEMNELHSDKLLSLNILAREYEMIKDYKNLAQCQGKIMKYLNHQSPFDKLYFS